MTTTDTHEPHAASPTATLIDELQLYGHRPFTDEPDPRPLPDATALQAALTDVFDAMIVALSDTRLEPDLENLLWSTVNVFHRATSGDHPVYIFWRASKHPCFTYAGEGRPSDVSDTEPPVITWSLDGGSVADDHATELPLARGAFRRGPAHTTGQRFVVVTNVSGDLYLAVLRGLRSQTFVHVKIGVTCDTRRRMRELNWSLPEATGIGWSLYSVWRFEDAETAYAMETRLLEAMRLKGWWSMGEFGAIPQSAFLEFAASFDEIGLHPAAVTSAPV